MITREPPQEHNGIPPMVNIKQDASAKSQVVEGASHWPAVMSSCLLVTYGSPVYLVVDELRHCVLWPLIIELMVVLLTFF